MLKLLNAKVFNNLLGHWTFLGPVGVGGTWALTSLIFGLGGTFIGFAAAVVGCASAATRYALSYEDIMLQVLKEEEEAKILAHDKELDVLYEKLVKTRGTRDEEALATLRLVYKTFASDIKAGKYTNVVSPVIMRQMDEMFKHCVELLASSYDLWEDAGHATEGNKAKILADRKIVLNKVDVTIERFNEMTADIRSASISESSNILEKLAQTIQTKLEVTQAANEEVRAIREQLEESSHLSLE
jgi:hypothetical protein